MSTFPEIPNESLSETDLPPPNADWNQVSQFAITYDGYERCGSFEKCADIANARLGGSLHNLRTCLFFEQRRWRHFGDYPGEEHMAYFHRIIEEIRELVKGH